jgi:amidase
MGIPEPSMTISPKQGLDRRDFLNLGLAAGAFSVAAPLRSGTVAKGTLKVEELGLVALQAGLVSGRWTSKTLVVAYLARIRSLDQSGPTLRAVIELNPDALEIAAALDRERKEKGPRGPLHGIPILIKDNIDTADRMHTTAASMALLDAPTPKVDAFVAQKLREAGAVILGKTNLSEWANFRGKGSTSGWSGRGGLTRNPYALDRNPSGSSSGSAVAVAASLCAAAVGTGNRWFHRQSLQRLRHRGPETHPGFSEPPRHHSHRPQPGHCGPHGPHGAGRGDPSGRHGRPGPQGFSH